MDRCLEKTLSKSYWLREKRAGSARKEKLKTKRASLVSIDCLEAQIEIDNSGRTMLTTKPFRSCRYTLWINLNTANQLGLTIPQWTLMKADRVIQ